MTHAIIQLTHLIDNVKGLVTILLGCLWIYVNLQIFTKQIKKVVSTMSSKENEEYIVLAKAILISFIGVTTIAILCQK